MRDSARVVQPWPRLFVRRHALRSNELRRLRDGLPDWEDVQQRRLRVQLQGRLDVLCAGLLRPQLGSESLRLVRHAVPGWPDLRREPVLVVRVPERPLLLRGRDVLRPRPRSSALRRLLQRLPGGNDVQQWRVQVAICTKAHRGYASPSATRETFTDKTVEVDPTPSPPRSPRQQCAEHRRKINNAADGVGPPRTDPR